VLLVSALLFVIIGWDGVWGALVKLFRLCSSEIYPFRFLIIAVWLSTAAVLIELGWWVKRKSALWVLFAILIVPVIFGNYARNQQFIAIATLQAFVPAPRGLKHYWLERITAVPSDSSHSVNLKTTLTQVTIPAKTLGGALLTLPWLMGDRLDEFSIEGADVAPNFSSDSAVVLTPHKGVEHIVITPVRSLSSSSLLYAALVFLFYVFASGCLFGLPSLQPLPGPGAGQ